MRSVFVAETGHCIATQQLLNTSIMNDAFSALCCRLGMATSMYKDSDSDCPRFLGYLWVTTG